MVSLPGSSPSSVGFQKPWPGFSLPTLLGWLLCTLQLLQGLTQNRRLAAFWMASLIIYPCAFLSSNLLLALKSKIPEKQHWPPTISSGEAPSSGPVLVTTLTKKVQL